jgi:hypothetical protein
MNRDGATANRALVAAAIVIGLALLVLAVVYWADSASALPSWLPGHKAGSSHHHVKHGIAAFFVGLALLVYAWFQTGSAGPRRASRNT